MRPVTKQVMCWRLVSIVALCLAIWPAVGYADTTYSDWLVVDNVTSTDNVTVTNQMNVGSGGYAGTLNQTAGTVDEQTATELRIGYFGNGTYNMLGSARLTTLNGSNQEVWINETGNESSWNMSENAVATIGGLNISNTGTISLSGSAQLSATTATLGWWSGTGTLKLSGNASAVFTQDIYTGKAGSGVGSGVITVRDNASLTTSTWMYLGTSNNGTGSMDISGGTVSAQKVILGNEANTSGTLSMTGGILKIGGSYDGVGISNTSASYAVNLGGAATIQSMANWDSSVAMNLTSGSVTFDTAAHDTTLSGILSGNGGVTKAGDGTLTLSGLNSYIGDTVVQLGLLSLSNNCLNDASTVSLASGGKLALNFSGSDTIDHLYLGGIGMAAGTWGATGSGADHINDAFFSGTGTLNVLSPIPEPNTLALAMAALFGLAVYAWRRRK